ncbi:hypothetical protein ACOY5P_23285 [Enterobacter asburiae]|uniref:hypothetical protein n=1 Tax=Enterobacter asburiae TaxID=61645 RepID=UPI002FF84DA0
MSNDDLINAIGAINFTQRLFETPSSREEEELRHLLSAVRQRLQEMSAERDGSSAQKNQ